MDELTEIEAIKRLKYRYLRAIDTKEIEELRGCMTEECRAELSGGKHVVNGLDAFMEHMQQAYSRTNLLTLHHAHHPEIDIEGDGTARATWMIHDRSVDLSFNINVWGASVLNETYQKVGDAWKIKATRDRRLFKEMESRADRAGLKLMVSMFDGAPDV